MSGDLPPDDEEPGHDNSSEPGHRKDGKPFKDGNTRKDGSYGVGKFRPPSAHQFAKDDGRQRGKRAKGSKNASTIWNKKLGQKLKIGDKQQTALEWLVEALIRRGITVSDRAAQTAIEKAEHLDNQRERQLGRSDADILAAWFAQQLSVTAGEILDDMENDNGPSNEASNNTEGNDHADQ